MMGSSLVGYEESPLREDYYVLLVDPGSNNRWWIQILSVEAFHFRWPATGQTGFGTVAAQTTSTFSDVDQLEPNTNRLFFVKVGVHGSARIRLKLIGKDTWGVDEDTDVGWIDVNRSPWFAPNPAYGFWLITQWWPAFSAENTQRVGFQPELHFEGWKYDTRRVEEGSDEYQRLVAHEIPYRTIQLGGTFLRAKTGR